MKKEFLEQKRESEKAVVAKMIQIYCEGMSHERPKDDFCPEYQRLPEYAHMRIHHCPQMTSHSFCGKRPISCYAPGQKEQIRKVMQFSEPRVLFHNPWMALRHVASSNRFRNHKNQKGLAK